MDVEALYRAYAPALLAFLTARSPDPATAEDLHHVVWVRALARPQDLSADHTRRWLFTVAKNLLTDYWRRPGVRARTVGISPDLPATDPDPPDDRLARLRFCIGRLSADYRAVVEARFAGESSAETGIRLNIPPSLVDTRYHKAKDRLRACAGGTEI